MLEVADPGQHLPRDENRLRERARGSLVGSTVAVLGVSFKAVTEADSERLVIDTRSVIDAAAARQAGLKVFVLGRNTSGDA